MRKIRCWTAVVLGFVSAAALAAPVSAKSASTQVASSKFELLAQKMLPEEKVNRAAGFFGPVVKKYLPTFQKFQQEYATATGKRAIIEKYLPDAQNALAEAKVMKVPAKYEQEKAEYIQMCSAFLSVLNVSLAVTK